MARALHPRDFFGEQPRVEIEADRVHVARLLRAQQIARAANLQVLHRDAEARAQFGRLEDGAQPFLGDWRQLLVLVIEKVGVRLLLCRGRRVHATDRAARGRRRLRC